MADRGGVREDCRRIVMSSADNAITADSSRQRKLGVILGYVNTAVQTVVSFLYTPLLLGGIGQSEYGLYQIIGSLTAYINIFESMLTASVLRFYCQEKSEGDAEGMETVLAVARRLYAACSCLVVVSAAAFAAFFQTAYSATLTEGELREGLAMLAIVCANIVVNMLFYTYSVVVQGNERFVFAKLLELAGLVIQPVLVIVLIGGCPQAIVISVVQLAVSLASCVVKRFYAVGRLRCRIRAHGPARRMTRSMLGFSGIMFVSMVADIVFAKTGQLLVGIAMSASAVAIFSVGYQVYQAYATLGRMVSTVFVPHVTDLSKGGDPKGELSRLWAKTGRVSAFILSTVLVVFGFFGEEFIGLWVGDGYGEAYLVAMIMMVAFVPDVVQALGLTILQVVDKYAFRSAVYVLSALANVALSVPLIETLGICGSAVASLIVLMVGSGVVMNVYYAKSVGLDVGGFWREVLSTQRALPLVVVAGFGVRLIALPSAVATFLVHCALLAVAALAAFYCLSMNDLERGMVRGLGRRLAPKKER